MACVCVWFYVLNKREILKYFRRNISEEVNYIFNVQFNQI